MGALVTLGILAPTCCGSGSCGGAGSRQQLVVAADLLLLVVLVFAATSLSDSAHIGFAILPHLWGTWGLPGTTLCGPGTLVHQGEELCDILDVMRGEFFQHLPIPHTLAKCKHNRSIGDMRNGVVNLGKQLNEGAQRFPRALLHDMEVDLITWPRVSTFKVGSKVTAQLLLGGESALRQVHEP
jgi:hypothetical protein